jgi:LysM repeat protein
VRNEFWIQNRLGRGIDLCMICFLTTNMYATMKQTLLLQLSCYAIYCAASSLVQGPLIGSLGSSNVASFNVMPLGQQITTLSSVPPYTVQAGDTLSGIAAHFGLSLACIEASNPQITNPDLIFPGQLITLPSANSTIEYQVVAGDYLEAIAHRFGITLEALEAANPQIKNPDLIFPGQVINVPNVCSINVDSALFPCGDAFYRLNAVSILQI